MMRPILFGAGSLLLVTACGPGPAAKIAETCSLVMADPDIRGDLDSANLSVSDYCGCVGKKIAALPQADRDTAVSTMEMVAVLMAENNGSAEAAFQKLRTNAREDGATPEAIAAYENMDELGEQLEEYIDELRLAQGVCQD